MVEKRDYASRFSTMPPPITSRRLTALARVA
jgi:hypothetical protein